MSSSNGGVKRKSDADRGKEFVAFLFVLIVAIAVVGVLIWDVVFVKWAWRHL
jgi:hypothetical protein